MGPRITMTVEIDVPLDMTEDEAASLPDEFADFVEPWLLDRLGPTGYNILRS